MFTTIKTHFLTIFLFSLCFVCVIASHSTVQAQFTCTDLGEKFQTGAGYCCRGLTEVPYRYYDFDSGACIQDSNFRFCYSNNGTCEENENECNTFGNCGCVGVGGVCGPTAECCYIKNLTKFFYRDYVEDVCYPVLDSFICLIQGDSCDPDYEDMCRIPEDCGCDSNDECRGSDVCVNGVCVECDSNDDCYPGDLCYENQCIPDISCEEDPCNYPNASPPIIGYMCQSFDVSPISDCSECGKRCIATEGCGNYVCDVGENCINCPEDCSFGNNNFEIIPRPKEADVDDTISFLLNGTWTIYVDLDNEADLFAAQEMQDWIIDTSGSTINVSIVSIDYLDVGSRIVIGNPYQNSVISSLAPFDVPNALDEDIYNQGYVIDIDLLGSPPNQFGQILILGDDPEGTGCFYGVITMTWLLKSDNYVNGWALPKMTITDWPDTEIRGHFLESLSIPPSTEFEKIDPPIEFEKIDYLVKYKHNIWPSMLRLYGCDLLDKWDQCKDVMDYAKKRHFIPTTYIQTMYNGCKSDYFSLLESPETSHNLREGWWAKNVPMEFEDHDKSPSSPQIAIPCEDGDCVISNWINIVEDPGFEDNPLVEWDITDVDDALITQVNDDPKYGNYCVKLEYSAIFSDNMEDGSSQWTADSPWAISSEDVHSGSYAWSDSPGGDYGIHDGKSLISLQLDLSGLNESSLTFWHKYDFNVDGDDKDFGEVQVTTDGSTWEPEYKQEKSSNGKWVRRTIDLTHYCGYPTVQIRFRLVTNKTSGVADGWHIDDVNINYTLKEKIFYDDMELGAGQWTAESPWAITNEAKHSGLYSWSDSPGGNYGNNLDIYLTYNSVPFDLSLSNKANLSFWHKHVFASNDAGELQISDDGWSNFEILDTFTGTQQDWKQESYDLTSYLGESSVQIRFRLDTDNSGVADGWYIDDVDISSYSSDLLLIDPGSVPPVDPGYLYLITFWVKGDFTYGSELHINVLNANSEDLLTHIVVEGEDLENSQLGWVQYSGVFSSILADQQDNDNEIQVKCYVTDGHSGTIYWIDNVIVRPVAKNLIVNGGFEEVFLQSNQEYAPEDWSYNDNDLFGNGYIWSIDSDAHYGSNSAKFTWGSASGDFWLKTDNFIDPVEDERVYLLSAYVKSTFNYKLNEDFEAVFPPSDWYLFPEVESGWVINQVPIRNGSYAAYHSGSQDAWLIVKVEGMSNLVDPKLIFWEYVVNKSPDDTLEVLYSIDYSGSGNPLAGDWKLITDKPSDENTWSERVLTIPGFTALLDDNQNPEPDIIYIAWHIEGDNGTNWYIDDVAVGQTPKGHVRAELYDQSGNHLHAKTFFSERSTDWNRFTVVFNTYNNNAGKFLVRTLRSSSHKYISINDTYWIDDVELYDITPILANVIETADMYDPSVGGGTKLEVFDEFCNIEDENYAAFDNNTPYDYNYPPNGKLTNIEINGGTSKRKICVDYDFRANLRTNEPISPTCISDPNVYAKYRELILDEAIEYLSPEYICIEGSEFKGIGRDSRSQGIENYQLWANHYNGWLAAIQDAINDNSTYSYDAKVMFIDDMLNPYHGGNNSSYQITFGGKEGAAWWGLHLFDKSNVIPIMWGDNVLKSRESLRMFNYLGFDKVIYDIRGANKGPEYSKLFHDFETTDIPFGLWSYYNIDGIVDIVAEYAWNHYEAGDCDPLYLDICDPDEFDDNCDGTPDEDYENFYSSNSDYAPSLFHCGGCNNPCISVYPNMFTWCDDDHPIEFCQPCSLQNVGNECEYCGCGDLTNGCLCNFYDLDGQHDAYENGCEYFCMPENPESPESTCDDNEDNDCDGLTDLDDPDCD